jgi:inhibitor of KinA sporulation pathway (predicted exonuclease)
MNKTIFTFLDLEMNQPSGKIIQIGAVVGNIATGEVLERVDVIINCEEEISDYITKLTGITQQQVDNGVSLLEGYHTLVAAHQKHNSFMNLLTWGGGDSRVLKEQLAPYDNVVWVFGRRFDDVKTVFRAYQLATGGSTQGGLAKSLTKLGLKFSGTKHSAVDDAYNTMVIYKKLLKLFKNG